MTALSPTEPKRHKGFEETHRDIIDTTVRLVSKKGADAVSVAAVARELGINRTTVYYHFDSREALLDAVKAWSSEQIARAFQQGAPQQQRIDFIFRFVLENPEVVKLWIDDFLAPGDIRNCYPHWDKLVEGIRALLDGHEDADAEVYSVILLTSAFIGPRVFKNSVAPNMDIETIVERFRKEQQRLLKHDALLKAEP